MPSASSSFPTDFVTLLCSLSQWNANHPHQKHGNSPNLLLHSPHSTEDQIQLIISTQISHSFPTVTTFSLCCVGCSEYIPLMFCAPNPVISNLFSPCCWQNNSGHVSSLSKILFSPILSTVLPWMFLSTLLSWQACTILLTLCSNRTSFMKLCLTCFISYTRFLSLSFSSALHPVKAIQLHL